MTNEEYINFANCLKNNYTIDFDVLPEFCDMAISALSEEDNTMEWEEVSEEYDEVYDIDGVHTYADKRRCNRCGLVHYFIEGNGIYNFCPNCGRRAVKHDR